MDFLFQNNLMLLSAGLFLALPVLLVLLFVKKLYKKGAFVALTLAFCAVFALCLIGALATPAPVTDGEEEEEEHTVVYASEKDYLSAFCAYLTEGCWDEAERIMKESANVHGWSGNCSLMSAHLAFAKENYPQALALYTKVASYAPQTDALRSAAQALVNYYANDGGAAEELKAAGYTLALSDAQLQEARNLLNGGAKTLLAQNLQEGEKLSSYRAAALFGLQVEQLWTDATQRGEDVSESVAVLEAELEKMADKKKLERLGAWRVARMKLRLLGSDYTKLISDLDEHATCEEYTVALDLYLNGKVSAPSLKKAFGIESFEGTDFIVEQLKLVRREAELTDEQEELLDDQIERIEKSTQNQLFYHMENGLLRYAEDRDQLKNASKIYLALGQYCGNLNQSAKRNEYFSQALTAAANSDDGAYAEAMNGLAQAVSDSDNYESLKNVEQYASQAVQNSSFVDGAESMVRDPEKESQLESAVGDYTLKAGAAVTINSIDSSKFNQITATIQVSDEFMSEKELQNILKLKDCLFDIESFTVTKVEFEKANIILCCDNSGSMSGSISSLQNAVTKFLETSTPEEQIGFYTFDSSILQSLPLGSSMEELMAAVGKMNDQGGTNIYGTVYSILSSAPTELDANNILILMTDGQDGYSGVTAQEIADLAFSKGYVLYVMGMGDGIEGPYLQALSDLTGGEFLYSPSDSQLESLYTFLHGQVKNRYLVTYQTVDTLTVTDRPLEIGLKDQTTTAIRYYSLSESDEDTAILPFDHNVSVAGLETRYMVKQKNVTNIDVKGTGFQNTDSMVITLKGKRSFDLRASYIDENTFRISVPAEIPLGIYDMEVKLNNRFAVFYEELTVGDGTVDEICFGGYRFSAEFVTEEQDGYTLSGNVTMNDWLKFNGSIRLEGDLEGNDIVLVDYSGSRVSFASSGADKGLAKYLKDKSIALPIPALGRVTLFNSPSVQEDYPTSAITVPLLKLIDFMMVDTPVLRLAPDKISMEFEKGSASLPFQDLLLDEVNDNASPFSFEFECEGTLTSNNISLKGEAALNYSTGEAPFLVKFLDTTATMEKTLGKLEFDTAEGSLGVEFNVKLPMFPVDTYVGLGLQWVNMSLDGVQLHLDRDFTKLIGPVPITFSDFSLGFVGLAQTTKNASNETVSALTLEGKMQVSAGKVSAIVPKLKKYVGDVAVLQIPEATFRCGLARFSVEAEATLELLSCVELLEAKIALGNHDFSNPLLGLNKENVAGIYVMLKKGLSWDAHNLKVELSGKGEFAINNRFIGAAYTGTAELEMNWWIFEKTYHKDGNALVGFYTDYSGNTQFTVRASYTDGNKRKGAIFYITENGKMDYDLNYKY